MSNDLDATRRSTLATLDEIVDTTRALKAQGIDPTDPDEWQQLCDIVARIERKLGANAKDDAA